MSNVRQLFSADFPSSYNCVFESALFSKTNIKSKIWYWNEYPNRMLKNYKPHLLTKLQKLGKISNVYPFGMKKAKKYSGTLGKSKNWKSWVFIKFLAYMKLNQLNFFVMWLKLKLIASKWKYLKILQKSKKLPGSSLSEVPYIRVYKWTRCISRGHIFSGKICVLAYILCRSRPPFSCLTAVSRIIM